ncbi:hypothetical protein B0H19DRAFT_1235020 [Mycena capillaripes]|nr:hypothetical protein B0H19DRAFT_1235020 [Mycena capillaripes]
MTNLNVVLWMAMLSARNSTALIVQPQLIHDWRTVAVQSYALLASGPVLAPALTTKSSLAASSNVSMPRLTMSNDPDVELPSLRAAGAKPAIRWCSNGPRRDDVEIGGRAGISAVLSNEEQLGYRGCDALAGPIGSPQTRIRKLGIIAVCVSVTTGKICQKEGEHEPKDGEYKPKTETDFESVNRGNKIVQVRSLLRMRWFASRNPELEADDSDAG